MIVVIGSSNTDMVIKCEHLPTPGETILGGNFFMNAGGKGANQAVAAARLNGDVTFIAKVGNDVFGKEAIELFNKENIKTEYIFVDDKNPSGVALITVDANGENCIAVAQGANGNLSVDDLNTLSRVLEQAEIILAQLETPVATIEYAASIAVQKNIQFILNPAPACKLPDELLSKLSVITPNEKEAEMLTGVAIKDIDDAKQAAKILSAKGIKTIIITLGEAGALLYHNNQFNLIAGKKVNAVDTTAAGDVFNGALAVALSEKKSFEEAIQFANTAAAISVTRLGAQASAPYRSEL
ncbi:MAG TPA: ribokinase [Parafilimonas sp.]|nr:ribokinase [Parafilimonas sp.]